MNSNLQHHFKTKTKSFAGQFWLFMFWPFLSLVFSFINYRQVNSKNIIWLFTIFLGATFYFSESDDSARYILQLEKFSKLNFSDFYETELKFDGNFKLDFIQPLINFLVSRFSTDGHVLYMVYGAIFGFFYSRNIAYLLERFETKIKPESLAYLIIFVCYMPFHTMNGFRFNTSVHIFIYGLIHFIIYPKKMYGIFFIVSTIFLHDTFLIAVFLFFLFFALKNNIASLHILFYFYLLTFILSNLDTEIISNLIDNTGFIRKQRIKYLDEEYAEAVFAAKEMTNFYVRYKFTLVNTLITGSYIWIYFRRFKLIEQNIEIKYFFLFSLIVVSFVNLVDNIPSMPRFYAIGYMSFAAMLFLFFSSYHFVRRPEWYRILTFFVAYLISLSIVWDGFVNWTLSTILANPLTFWLFESEDSINALIKSFIF